MAGPISCCDKSMEGSSLRANLITGSGQNYGYFGPRPGGAFLTPQSNSVNTLFATSGWTAYTETQPDGTA